MRFKVLIIILHFIILLFALVHCFFSIGFTCHKCPDTIVDGQFLDVVCFGLLLLIFIVCVSIMAKEEIPPKMQLTISFLAATLYFLAAALLIYVFVGYRTFVPVQLTCAILLGALHLCVGLLHFFRDRIKALT